MSKGTLVGISIIAVLVIIVIVVAASIIGVINTEVKLANRYDAQFNVVETTLDTMRKTIMNQHKCTKEWADQFIAVVAEQVKGRPGPVAAKGANPGGIMGTLTGGTGGIAVTRESESLGIPQDLYMKLANSIEGKLAEFKRSQDTLTDVWRAHKTHCEVFPNSLFVGGKVKEKPEMISSKVTKMAVETKELEDDLL